jgi:hypothetical protein
MVPVKWPYLPSDILFKNIPAQINAGKMPRLFAALSHFLNQLFKSNGGNKC